MNPSLHQYLTSDEVAVLLHCESRTVEDLLRRGDLPGLKLGRNWLLPSEALHQRLNQMALDGAEERRKACDAATTPRAVHVATSERKKARVRPDLTGL